MEYRQLPHGNFQERLSVLGLGMGGIQNCPEDEIEEVIRTAIANGVNFFDLCAGGKNVYAPFGRAIAGQREKVHFSFTSGPSITRKASTAGPAIFSKSKKHVRGSWKLWKRGTPTSDFSIV